jgi:Na+-transporting methylmalonyl-CoA/oxaloacetate decarboxylase gamma subunit
MWSEALRVATLGFSVVFITLLILAISVKVMSFFCRGLGKKEVRKAGKDYEF